MADNVNLIKYMNEFDNSAPIGASFDEKKFDAISKKLSSQDKNEKDEALAELPAKVKNLVKIVSKTVERLNATLGAKFPNMRQLDLEKSVTFNASGATGKFEIIEAGKEQHISFNVKKLSMYPSLEVSAIITKSVIDALAKQNNKENDKEFYNSILLYSQDGDHPKTKEEKDIIKAKNIIAGYLRNFLPAVYADEFERFVAISDYIAKQIIEELGENDIENILSPFFDLDTLDLQSMSIEKVDAFLGQTHKARVSGLSKRADEFLLDPEKEVIGLSYLDQISSILGTDTSDPNHSDIAKKFETMSNGEKCLTGAAVKEFCVSYVHDFLSSRNVVDMQVTFNNKGALGSFYESEFRININLQKLKKMGSYTELAMTLSHELTHAVDAVKTNGLQNDISEKFVHTSENEEVKDFMKDLLKLSYKVNPNERRARIGEISALMFMTRMAKNSPSIQEEIKVSIAKYKTYQDRTRRAFETVKNKLTTTVIGGEKTFDFDGKIAKFISEGAIIEGSPLYKEIQERLKYLSDFGLNASVEQEMKSIEIVDLMLNGEQGLEEILRREEAKIAREEEARKVAEESQTNQEEARKVAEEITKEKGSREM